MPRVAIVARSSAERALLRARAAGADIEVVGDGPSVADDLLERAEVLIVMGETLLAQALDWADEDEELAVIGLVPNGSAPAEWPIPGGGSPAHAATVRGWALLPDDVDARTLRAAIVAADAGLASWPVGWAQRAMPPDAPIGFVEDEELFGTETLTPREQEVLELLSIGLSNRRIAERLGISGHTVKFHVAAIYGKLGVSGRTAAVNRALRRGILKI
jgi:two-component system nitrate/nitrite response regulator NarL